MFPAKLFEYMAAGKPILSSVDFSRELGETDIIQLCRTKDQFVSALKRIAGGQLTISPTTRARMLSLAQENTWEHKAAEWIRMVKAKRQLF